MTETRTFKDGLTPIWDKEQIMVHYYIPTCGIITRKAIQKTGIVCYIYKEKWKDCAQLLAIVVGETVRFSSKSISCL